MEAFKNYLTTSLVTKVCIIENRTGSPSYYRLVIESINTGLNLVNTDIHAEKRRYCKLRYLELKLKSKQNCKK